MICKNCQKQYDGQICPSCGEKADEMQKCPVCGTERVGEEKKCTNCGYDYVQFDAKVSEKIKDNNNILREVTVDSNLGVITDLD